MKSIRFIQYIYELLFLIVTAIEYNLFLAFMDFKLEYVR